MRKTRLVPFLFVVLFVVLFVAMSCVSGCGDDAQGGDAGTIDGSTDSATDSGDAALSPDGDLDGSPGVDAAGDCVDPDGDGYGTGAGCLGSDCAPDDPERHPGAVEVCDLVDNNCDNQIDELAECALPRIWVFLLAGQSNMVGLGYNTELTGVDTTAVANTAIYYNPSIHANTNALQWLGLAPGFGANEGLFGLELNFGRRLQVHWPGRSVAIIKVAEGGTALHDRWDAPNGDLYQLLVSETQTQLAALAQNYQPQVVGMLWMQGESDAINSGDANAYHSNLTDFMTSLRQVVGIEYMPLAAGLIAIQSLWPYADTVRGATATLSQELGQMDVVETTDLPRHPGDLAHYNTSGNLTLGYRFAESMASMLPSSFHFQAGVSAVQGDGSWLYNDRLGAAVIPMTYDAANQRWAGSDSFQLIGPGWMHPGATRDAELVWWAPHAALVQIDVDVSAGDNGGGDGTWVSIARDNNVLWGPVPIPNNTSEQHSFQLIVQQGQQLQFRTSSGPANDASNDTTAWQLDIDVLDVDP